MVIMFCRKKEHLFLSEFASVFVFLIVPILVTLH